MGTLKVDIPIYWFPSPLSITKGYMALSRLKCPRCSGRLVRILQEVLPEREGWPYPISGYLFRCRCEKCGDEVDIELELREPGEGDDPFADFIEVFKFCLDEFEDNPQAFAGRVYAVLTDVVSHRPDLADKLIGFIADEAVTTAYGGGDVTPHALLSIRLRDEEFMKLLDMLPPGLARLFSSLRGERYH